MVYYEVTVFTGNRAFATTINNVYIKLVGTDGESCRTWAEGPLSFIKGAASSFTVSCPVSIGKLILIELDKKCLPLLPEDAWFPAKVDVKSPEGDTYTFPIYRWITDSEVHYFREGTALRVFEDNSQLGRYSRQQELTQREEDYCWDVCMEGMPHCIKAKDPCSLPPEVRFSFTKNIQFAFTAITGVIELKLDGLADCKKKWTDMYHLNKVFWHRTQISEYVHEHWKDDAFFGYQFLNGVNPILIRRCTALPSNFPLDDDMVFTPGVSKLKDEMEDTQEAEALSASFQWPTGQSKVPHGMVLCDWLAIYNLTGKHDNLLEKGNIFLVDYSLLDGVETNTVNGKKQYLTAPLVLLHKTPQDQLMPVAIQLKQTPGDDNPIFFPTDSEYDWLMAKIFVRSADFNIHELSVHLLRAHLLAEVFAVSLLRNVPMVHPLYKLLIPHTRYTLQINILARLLLISENGVFTHYAASGGEGMFTILKRSMSSITYSSLCLPDDIAERGLQDVPNFYYRDDGLQHWDIIHKFVQGVLSYYYKNDSDVQQDSELQKWISDIFEHGFLSKASTGIPQQFATVTELVKFVTMVIFTCSARHAAVNSGQYDYGGWMPNTPITLQLPPPTSKGKTHEATILETLPDVNATVHGMGTVWLLSKQSTDFVPLGDYPEEHFTEKIPRKLIKEFQGRLKVLKTHIEVRNESLEVPYTYLNPTEVENSVAL